MRTFRELLFLPHYKRKYLTLLYVVSTLRSFVFAFLSLFLPIILLNQFINSGFNEKSALIWVGVSFFILFLTHASFILVSANIISSHGVKISLFISQIFFLIFLSTFGYSSRADILILSFIIWGVAAAFWWIAYHTYFVEVGKKIEFGREIGISYILDISVGALAPFLAGLLLNYFDKSVLLRLAFVVTTVSLVGIVFLKDFEKLERVNIGDFVNELIRRKREFIAFVGVAAEQTIYSIVWPLFLFKVLKQYLLVGSFSSLVVLTAIFVSYMVGVLSDKISKEKLEKVGSYLVSFSWLGKALTQSSLVLFIFDSIYRLSSSFFYLPITALAYNHAVFDSKSKYLVYREIAYKLGNMLGMIFFIILIYFDFPLVNVFLLAALFSLSPVLLKEGKKN